MDHYGTSTIALREKCIHLLNEAQLSADVKEKLQKLASVQEILLYQLQLTDETSEHVLRELVHYVCQLVTDRHQEVKKWMINVLCQVAKDKDASLLPQVIEVVYHVLVNCMMVEDTDSLSKYATLVKSSLQTLTDLFPLAFQRTCFFPEEFRTTWQQITTMKEMVVSQFLTCDNEGIRTHTIKFFQTMIMVYSSPYEALEDISGMDMNAMMVGDAHPYLIRSQTIQEAKERFNQLLDQVHSKKMSSGNILTILNAVGSILKSRPQHLTAAINVLLPLQKSPPLHLTPSQIKSLHHTLKLLLQSFLKLPGAEAYKGSIQEVWGILAGKVHTKAAKYATVTSADRRTNKRTLSSSGSSSSISNSSNISSSSSGSSSSSNNSDINDRMNMSRGGSSLDIIETIEIDMESKRQRMYVDPEIQKTLFNMYLFPYPFVVDLVIISMLNLPVKIPGYVSQQIVDMVSKRWGGGVEESKKGGDVPKRDSRLLLQTRAPMMMAAIDGPAAQHFKIRTPTGILPLQSLAADIASFNRPDESRSMSVTSAETIQRIIGTSYALRDVQGLLTRSFSRELPRLHEGGDDHSMMELEPSFMMKTKADAVLKEPRHLRTAKPFVLQVTDEEEYSFEKLTGLLKNIFERLINNEVEQLAQDTGTRKAWISLICKLITTDINSSIEMEHLKDLMREKLDAFILENFKERYELAITWMYHEYAADEQRKLSMIKDDKRSIKVSFS
jgi:hypothetical protein